MTNKCSDDGSGSKSVPAKRTQWDKGTSGNPKGRPKKSATEAFDQGIDEMTLTESRKPIPVKEGGKAQTLPALQAVKRRQLLSALQGNPYAMRSYIQQATDAEARQKKRREEAIAQAFASKLELEAHRIEWVAAGKREEDMIAHPTDIEVDPTSGEVKYFLALTADEQRHRSKLIEFRDYLLSVLERSEAAAAEDGDDIFLQSGRRFAQSAVKALNGKLPMRFRRVPPETPRPLSLEDPPEHLWRELMKPVVQLLFPG